jgi:hypothetical protein
MSANKYYDYVLRHPARAIYANLTEASRPVETDKTK